MSDLISRQAALHAVSYETFECYEARKAIRALPSTDNWIPCSERLPEEYDEYLCQYDDGDMIVGWLENAEWCKEYVVKEGIVAWMPIPEPYRKEKQ